MRSFEAALEHDLGSIAFPGISTGAYGYPKDQAARIATGVMRRFAPRMRSVLACCFSEADAALYRQALAAPCGPGR